MIHAALALLLVAIFGTVAFLCYAAWEEEIAHSCLEYGPPEVRWDVEVAPVITGGGGVAIVPVQRVVSPCIRRRP